MALAAAVTTAAPWAYYATVDPTIGAAAIAATGSIITVLLNAALIRRHESHLDERLDERRLVAVRTEDGVMIADEERRQLEDRRSRPESRKVRERRRGRRRNDAS